MRSLALETSSSTGSIALFEDDRLVAESDLGAVELLGGQRTAQALAPALQSILREAAWEPRDVRLIAVTDGPGSFTGLRAGVTTAKVFAYATGAEVVAVNTLEVVAAQAEVVSDRLWVVMDAQRQQVFVAQFALTGVPVSEEVGRNKSSQFRQEADAAQEPDAAQLPELRKALFRPTVEPRTVLATQILDNDAWLDLLIAGDCVTGAGLVKLSKRVAKDVQIVAEEAWKPRAATLGRLAIAKHQSGERADFWRLVPQYFRKSAAEEKFDQGLLK